MQTLYQMDVHEYLERVEGALLWHEYQLDETLNNFAWFTANQMIATGNIRKNVTALDIKKSLYKSLEDVKQEQIPQEVKQAQKRKNAQLEREKLIKRFGLEHN